MDGVTAKEITPKNGVRKFQQVVQAMRDAWWVFGVIAAILVFVISYQLMKYDSANIGPVRKAVAEMDKDLHEHMRHCDEKHKLFEKSDAKLESEINKCISRELVESRLQAIQQGMDDLKRQQGSLERKIDSLSTIIMEKMKP